MIECWRSRLLADFSAIIAAWERSLPKLLCPTRLENGHPFVRVNPAWNNGSEWHQPFEVKAPHVWSFIEEEVTGEACRYPNESKIAAVVCLGGDRWKSVEGEETKSQ